VPNVKCEIPTKYIQSSNWDLKPGIAVMENTEYEKKK
jgi:hypothetical protein